MTPSSVTLGSKGSNVTHICDSSNSGGQGHLVSSITEPRARTDMPQLLAQLRKRHGYFMTPT